MKPPLNPVRALHEALLRAERGALRDVQDATRAWGSSDHSTLLRKERLDAIRARLAKGE